MDSKIELNTSDSSLMKATALFFKERSFGETQNIFFKLFQCWGLKDCQKRIDLTNTEVALFYDQLIGIVTAAYLLHQANRVFQTGQEEIDHD